MMTGLTAEITKTVAAIAAETGTTIAEKTLRSVRFWEACQLAQHPHEVLKRVGFNIDFQQDDECRVQEVTLRLNESWMTILRRVLDRNKA